MGNGREWDRKRKRRGELGEKKDEGVGNWREGREKGGKCERRG